MDLDAEFSRECVGELGRACGRLPVSVAVRRGIWKVDALAHDFLVAVPPTVRDKKQYNCQMLSPVLLGALGGRSGGAASGSLGRATLTWRRARGRT